MPVVLFFRDLVDLLSILGLYVVVMKRPDEIVSFSILRSLRHSPLTVFIFFSGVFFIDFTILYCAVVRVFRFRRIVYSNITHNLESPVKQQLKLFYNAPISVELITLSGRYKWNSLHVGTI